MQPARPEYLIARSLTPSLAGLGEIMTGAGASNGSGVFRSLCEQHIAGRLGAAALQNAKAAPDLAGCIQVCASMVQLGQSESLPSDQQAAWNAFKAATSSNDSPDNIYWMFAVWLSASSSRLAKAYYDQFGTTGYGWWDDAEASACNFVLLDTSSTGTTWYGGTTVQSRLTPDQWGTLFGKGWTVLMNGIANGVLPLTYLTAFLKGMLRPLVERRFIAFHPAPSGVDAQDPRAIAFRTAMKQLGWGNVTRVWYEATMQAWVEDDKAFQAQDSLYASAITGLSYLNGAVILDKIRAKMDEYWKVRADAVKAINDFYAMHANPEMYSIFPAADLETMNGIRQRFVDAENSARTSLASTGLWDDSQPGLGDLGAAQVIIAGVLAIGALGIIAYIIATMTEVSRSAAAQTKATADSILATVEEIKRSCKAAYDASAKDQDDEMAYQECLGKTQTLYAAIPPPPEGSDPLGFKSLALAIGVGLAAFLAVKLIPKKSPTA